jgi:DNA repair protein RadA/Sms
LAKSKTIFTCQQCGHQSPKWLGRCPDCGGWNTLSEEIQERSQISEFTGAWGISEGVSPRPLVELQGEEGERHATGIGELDRILGGGLVPGSLILIGGDPGIGKSTLLLQAMDRIAAQGVPVLYVTGEESSRQVKLRADRLDVRSPHLFIVSETALDRVLEAIRKIQPKVVVVDSVQTLFVPDLSSAPGSVSQVRESAGRLMALAKTEGITIFLVGHVTKDGSIAGPRVLEHMVDTVLYFEGGGGHAYRIIRAVKNRFGSSNEIGVFEMRDRGLVEVANPSELFLAERSSGISGSTVVATLEGTRPLLVEIQALVGATVVGTPRRTTLGVDHNKVSLLVAVLEKRASLQLMGHDVFVNVVGGVELNEPAIDLAITLAVASSFLNRPIDSNTIILGEVGLGGEVRAIQQISIRLKEAERLGFKRCLLPESNRKKLDISTSMTLEGVSSVDQALRLALESKKTVGRNASDLVSKRETHA